MGIVVARIWYLSLLTSLLYTLKSTFASRANIWAVSAVAEHDWQYMDSIGSSQTWLAVYGQHRQKSNMVGSV